MPSNQQNRISTILLQESQLCFVPRFLIMYQEILWASDWYLRQVILSGKLKADQMEKDFERMIEQRKKIYLK